MSSLEESNTMTLDDSSELSKFDDESICCICSELYCKDLEDWIKCSCIGCLYCNPRNVTCSGRRRLRLKDIHSRSNTNRTGAEGVSFYFSRLLYCLNQMLAMVLLSQHRVSSFKTVRPRAPCSARCIGHAVRTWLLFAQSRLVLIKAGRMKLIQMIQRFSNANNVKTDYYVKKCSQFLFERHCYFLCTYCTVVDSD